MLYQLPNGKVIQITFDQFLSMTDEDIQFFISINYGETINSPWHDSKMFMKSKKYKDNGDNSIDFEADLDEPDYFKNPTEEDISGLSIIENTEEE